MIEIGGTPIVNTGGGYGFDGMTGGGNWIWAFLLFALLGNGGFGGNRFGISEGDVYKSQQFQNIDNGLRSLGDGQCQLGFQLTNTVKDGNYATGMSIQGVNQNLGNAICTQTYELANLVRNVGDKVSSCCCSVERAIDSVKFEGERNTNAVIQSSDRNTQRILDWLSNKELADKNQTIFQMSQEAQTAKIIAAQKPVAPIPAYLQPNPYASYYGGYNGGCCNF